MLMNLFHRIHIHRYYLFHVAALIYLGTGSLLPAVVFCFTWVSINESFFTMVCLIALCRSLC